MITAAVFSFKRLFQRFQIDLAGFRIVFELRHGNTLMARVGSQHFAIFRMNGAGHGDAIAPGDPHGHHGGFGHGRGSVVHRRIGHIHAGQLADHGLEFEDRGERALRDLGLVRRVRSQKLAARDDRIHQHRAVMMIHARAQEIRVRVGVFAAARAEIIDDFVLAFARRNVQRAVEAHVFRKMRIQIFERRRADGIEHLAALDIRLR